MIEYPPNSILGDSMATLKFTEESELTPAEVKKLQAAFKKIEAKVEKLRPLEKQVIEANKVVDKYLAKLYELGQEFEAQFSENSDDLEINDDGVYFGDYPEATVAHAFNFWIPSSMGC